MRVLKSMSDIRTKLLLGTSIGAVTMMLFMASGIISTNDSIATTQTFPMFGHVEVLAVHPDGSSSYSQGDNLILGEGKDRAGAFLYDPAGAPGPFVCIGMGDAGTVVESDDGLTAALATFVKCDTTTNASAGGVDGGAGAGSVAVVEVVMPAIDADDLTNGAGLVTEVALGSGGGASVAITGVLSHIDLAVNVPVVLNTIVTITYTMTTG